MVKHAAVYGILGAFLVAFWFWMCFNLLHANSFFSFWGNLVILVVGVVVFFSIFTKSRKSDQFSFGQGLLLGGGTLLVMSVLGGTLLYIITQYFQPEIIELYKSESLIHLQKNKEALIADSSPEIYEAYLKSVPLITAYSSVQRYVFSNILVPGMMLSILSTLPLRK